MTNAIKAQQQVTLKLPEMGDRAALLDAIQSFSTPFWVTLATVKKEEMLLWQPRTCKTAVHAFVLSFVNKDSARATLLDTLEKCSNEWVWVVSRHAPPAFSMTTTELRSVCTHRKRITELAQDFRAAGFLCNKNIDIAANSLMALTKSSASLSEITDRVYKTQKKLHNMAIPRSYFKQYMARSVTGRMCTHTT